MIKQLKKKFTVTAMTAVTVLIVIIIGTINIFNCVIIDRQTDNTLDFLVERSLDVVPDKPVGGDELISGKRDIFDKPMDEDTFMASRCFMVYLSAQNDVIKTDTGRISSVDDENAREIAAEMLENNKYSGMYNGFKFTTAVVDTYAPFHEGYTSVMVFLDITDQVYSVLSVLVLSGVIAVVTWLLMLLLVVALSEKAIRPIAENMQQQKKFITNAGHEIKTPLAIILANTDALELHNGESKWSANIRTQTNRLTGLTEKLLTLSKMDEYADTNSKCNVELKNLIMQTTEPYFEIVQNKGVNFVFDIKNEAVVSAVGQSLDQLFDVLVDNAVKYARDNTDIIISLRKDAGKTFFQIINTCDNLPDAEPKKLFDRFYRGDSARTQNGTGGYGVGLSVAAAVCEINNADITAEYMPENKIAFSVRFKN